MSGIRKSAKIVCAAAALTMSAMVSTAHAVSVCTNSSKVMFNSVEDCVFKVIVKLDMAGIKGKGHERSVYVWFETNVVTIQCMNGNLIAYSSFHAVRASACPQLHKVKSAVEK